MTCSFGQAVDKKCVQGSYPNYGMGRHNVTLSLCLFVAFYLLSSFLISGGQKGGVPTATTEMYYPGSDVTSQGPDLPYKTAGKEASKIFNT